MVQNNVNKPQDDEVINIRETVFHYLNYWKVIVLSALICLALASLYLMKTNNQYEIKTSVLIKEDESSNSSVTESDVLNELGMPTGKNNIDNDIQVFQSADLVKNTITAVNYSTTYFFKSKLKKVKIYPSPVKLSISKILLDTISQSLEFQLSKTNVGYTLAANYANIHYQKSFSNFPAQLQFPFGVVTIESDGSSVSSKNDLYISVNNTENMAVGISGSIKIVPTTKQSSVLEISITTDNVNQGQEFLKKLVDIYNLQAIQDKNQISYNTALFIESRLKALSVELSSVEKNVEQFKSANKLTNISSQADAYMSQTSDNESKITDVETQLNVIKYVEDFVNDNKNKNHLIPNIGITDPGLSTRINSYNELFLNKERIQKASTITNPTIENLSQQLSNMKIGIKNNIINVKKALIISLRDLNSKNNLTTARIQQIPHIERKFSEINRQEQVKENLYEFLLQKREETDLALAATAPKAKIISNPRVAALVAPRRNVILLSALLLGLLIPIVIIFIREKLQISIKGMEDLETQSKAPVLGEIPFNKTDKQIVVEPDDTSSITELFRSLRNNLTFILSEPDKKIITVTSTISGEGKTFVGLNLACAFALIDKKVLLVGLDIRNPSLGKYANRDNSEGITSYLAKGGGKVDDYIEKTSFYTNLDVIYAGIIPPNPNELLNKQALDELFVELRKRYDYIIIDTAPVGVISDTFLINRVSDVTLYITRENITSKESISFINDLYENDRLKNIYVVLNASDIERKRYSGYSYKRGYNYYYGYQHKNEEKKYSFSSIVKDILTKPKN